MIKPAVMAALSWLFSLLVWNSYTDPTWQCLLSLALVDFVFMAAFYLSDVNDQKVRWICSLLMLSIIVNSISFVVIYAYQYHLINADFPILELVVNYYGAFGLSASILIMIVSLLNDRLMDKIDGLFWPVFAYSFRFDFDNSRCRNSKGGAF
jgi:hypothetical protein